MKKFGIIGSPINHSASPHLFRAGYKGKPYTYDLIEGDVFEESYQKFLDGYDGINVTAPFKVPAFEKADWRSDECARIGATNLLVKTSEGVKAYNSDYYGILLTVLHACRTVLDPVMSAKIAAGEVTPNFEGLPARPTPEECQAIVAGRLKTALIVGCGGAGKAAVIAALNLGLKTTIMNRSIDKAEAIAAKENARLAAGAPAPGEANQYPLEVRPLSDFAECFRTSDLVIYNIPGPIDTLADICQPNPADALPDICSPQPAGIQNAGQTNLASAKNTTSGPAGAKNTDLTTHKKLFIEANYRNPTFDEGRIAAVKANYPEVEFVPGRHWLLYQAYAGYDLFTGESPDLPAMIDTLSRL